MKLYWRYKKDGKWTFRSAGKVEILHQWQKEEEE